MDVIHLLPDSVANQIAAGEVIQRPASCLKELVENSLDAGATTVQVILYDAGRTMMQVVDDGKGMTETDARMAFERHATSKIRTADDLFSLHTMGFRGEALASICAVAQVELMTRREEDETGTRLVINGSQVEEQEPCSCAKGTSIKVKNLFFNVPARRRFLKTDATELRNILSEFYRIVLVNPQCHFVLTHQDELLTDLPSGSLKSRIEQVFGRGHQKQFTAGLVDIRCETELVNIYGYVGKPEIASKQAQQYFFVNNRFMRHPYFHKAVMTAYQGMLQADIQPPYFIYFDINPEAIDVNIHPTKTEIKFADEQSVWQILLATVREALGKFNIVPSLDFSDNSQLDIPVARIGASPVEQPQSTNNSGYNPFNQPSRYTPDWSGGGSGRDSSSVWSERRDRTESHVAGWQSLYQPLTEEKTTVAESTSAEHVALFGVDMSELTPLQVSQRFIALSVPEGLLLVDQHRAHVCVMFSKISLLLTDHRLPTQQLLFPEVVELTTDEMQVMQEAKNELEWFGFELSQFSPTAFSVDGVPALLGSENVTEVIRHILFSISDAGISAREQWRRHIALVLAGDVAIPAGRTMSVEEMKDLLGKLFAIPEHNYTPDGKRVMNILSNEAMMRMLQ